MLTVYESNAELGNPAATARTFNFLFIQLAIVSIGIIDHYDDTQLLIKKNILLPKRFSQYSSFGFANKQKL